MPVDSDIVRKKEFMIPLVDKSIVVFVGEAGWKPFLREIIKAGADQDPKVKCPKTGGRANGSWIWVWDITNRGTFLHEISHYLDMLYAYLNCETEGEFKAYISEWVYEKLLQYRETLI